MVLNSSKELSRTIRRYLARYNKLSIRLSAFQRNKRIKKVRKVSRNKRDLARNLPLKVRLMVNSQSLKESYLTMHLKSQSQLRRVMKTLMMMITLTIMLSKTSSKMTIIKVTRGDTLITKMIDKIVNPISIVNVIKKTRMNKIMTISNKIDQEEEL